MITFMSISLRKKDILTTRLKWSEKTETCRRVKITGSLNIPEVRSFHTMSEFCIFIRLFHLCLYRWD